MTKPVKVYCSYSAMEDIGKIIPNKRNTNKHSKDQIDLIAHSLKENGWRRPILIGTVSNTIVAGEGRYLAAKKLGLKKVPVDYQTFSSELAEYKYLEADNNTTKASEWDEEKFQINIESFNLSIDDVTLNDFGLLNLKKEEINEKEIDEKEIDEKEIDENSLDINNKCPSCGYIW